MKNVLIVYHYIAHYRVPLFRLLSRSDSPKYTICSGLTSEINIRTASTKLANTPIDHGGINWIIIKNWWIYKPFLIQFSILKHSISKKYNTIIYLGTMYYITTWLGAILARLTGKKVVFWSHGYIRDENNMKGFVRSIFYRLAHEMLVYGQRAKEILISKGFDESKIHLIYNSLDYDSQILLRKGNHVRNIVLPFKNPNLPCFGFIGRLTHQKKVEQLLYVLARINSDHSKANLLIIGSGEKEKDLKEKALELGVADNVHFYGACYDELTISHLIKSLNIVVSPGEVGLTAIHSLTYGVPVITHNRFDKQMPEYESIVPDNTGDFFQYDNLESLYRYIFKWLFNTDKEKNKEVCYKVIDRFYNPHKQKEIFDSVV